MASARGWLRGAAGAAALAGVLHTVPARAQSIAEIPQYMSPFNVGIFIGVSFLPTLRFAWGGDVRFGPVFFRAEARNLETGIFTLGASSGLPQPIPVLGEAGLSLLTNSKERGLAGGLHLGIGVGDIGAHLLFEANAPVLGDLKNWDLSLEGVTVIPEVGATIFRRIFPPRVMGRRLRTDDGHSLPNMVPGQPIPYELRMHAPDLERGLLASRWFEAARTEAAAVSSFERFGAELAALGAPNTLVRGAFGSARDEARHASLSAAIASRWTGLAWTSEILDAPPRWDTASDDALATLARETVLDGLFDEGGGVPILEEAAVRAQDEQTRTALARIAKDEQRHLDLQWAVVEWMWRSGTQAARDGIVRSASELSAQDDVPPSLAEADEELLARHGVLPADTEADIRSAHRERTLRVLRSLLST